MSDEDEGAAEPSPSKPRRKVLSGTQVLLALGTAAVLLAGNVVQFAYVLNPRLRPDPNERLQASLQPLTVERQVYIGDYLQRVTEPKDLAKVEDDVTRKTVDATNPTKAQLEEARPRAMCREGVAVYVNVTVEGLKKRRVELASYLYTAHDQRRVPNTDALLDPRELESPTDRFVESVFVDQPQEPSGRYFVRLELRTVSSKRRIGTLLAIGDSKRFGGWVPDLRSCLRQ
jgi:hypothetical protein